MGPTKKNFVNRSRCLWAWVYRKITFIRHSVFYEFFNRHCFWKSLQCHWNIIDICLTCLNRAGVSSIAYFHRILLYIPFTVILLWGSITPTSVIYIVLVFVWYRIVIVSLHSAVVVCGSTSGAPSADLSQPSLKTEPPSAGSAGVAAGAGSTAGGGVPGGAGGAGPSAATSPLPPLERGKTKLHHKSPAHMHTHWEEPKKSAK